VVRPNKKLKDEWDAKLRASGFVDIEKEVNGKLIIAEKDFSHGVMAELYRRPAEVVRSASEEYYRRLSQHCEAEKEFEDDSDKLIMELTSNGHSIKEISDELKKKGLRKHNRDTIRYIRRRYEHKWQIRQHKPHQMTSRRPTRS
jgi:hypothetical protein